MPICPSICTTIQGTQVLLRINDQIASGNFYLAQQRPNEALKYYEAACVTGHGYHNPIAYFLQALAHLALDAPDQATILAQEAVQITHHILGHGSDSIQVDMISYYYMLFKEKLLVDEPWTKEPGCFIEGQNTMDHMRADLATLMVDHHSSWIAQTIQIHMKAQYVLASSIWQSSIGNPAEIQKGLGIVDLVIRLFPKTLVRSTESLFGEHYDSLLDDLEDFEKLGNAIVKSMLGRLDEYDHDEKPSLCQSTKDMIAALGRFDTDMTETRTRLACDAGLNEEWIDLMDPLCFHDDYQPCDSYQERNLEAVTNIRSRYIFERPARPTKGLKLKLPGNRPTLSQLVKNHERLKKDLLRSPTEPNHREIGTTTPRAPLRSMRYEDSARSKAGLEHSCECHSQ